MKHHPYGLERASEFIVFSSDRVSVHVGVSDRRMMSSLNLDMDQWHALVAAVKRYDAALNRGVSEEEAPHGPDPQA